MLLVGEELRLFADLPIRVCVKVRVRCLGVVESSVVIVGPVVLVSLLIVCFGWDRIVVWVGVEVSYAGVFWDNV